MSNVSIHQTNVQRAKRRVYDRDFKVRVVQRIKCGAPPIQLSRELGVSPGMLGRWLREMQADPTHAFRGQGRRRPLQVMSEQLQREAARQKTERELFKQGLQWLSINPDMAFGFIKHYQTVWPVRLMCEVFGVSRSGYYDWLKRRCNAMN